MSKRGYISRYLMIVRRIKQIPYITYEELRSYLEHQFEFLKMQDDLLSVGFSQRTLQRDLREIRNVFGLDIEFSRSLGGYYIRDEEGENMNFQRMLESFDLFNSLRIAQDIRGFIHLEQQRPAGTEHLYGLLHAIRNLYQVRFTYESFQQETITVRTVAPLAMKEFRNRWYVIAEDQKDGIVKSFALDRTSGLEITGKKFSYNPNFSVEEHYRYCFGIVSGDHTVPQEVILSFDPGEGRYIKTLPLHPTQEIQTDNSRELRIKLKIKPTHDFIMEILSHGDRVKVVEPDNLVNEIEEILNNAKQQYK
jgi:predicted DNA-binding transcriptional regulator YafY